jgi:hypothetical protein
MVLKRSLPSLKLEGGTFGVIVHVDPGGAAYEVEFFSREGASLGTATVKASLISHVKRAVPLLTSEQEEFLTAITDSKQFTLEAVLARHASVRPVPLLTPGQIAFHGGLTSNPEAFSLAKVTAACSITHKAGVSLSVVETFSAISDPKNAHLFTREAAHRAFAHLKPDALDVQSRHITLADGNLFLDLGFEQDEAKRLLAEANRKIESKDDKEK